MGYQHHRHLRFVDDVQEQFLHVPACFRIKRTERFVHQRDLRRIGQHPCDGDALLHPAGQLFWVGMAKARQLDLVDEEIHPLTAFVDGHPVQAHAVLDILFDGQPRKRCIALEHHAAVATGPDDLLAVKGKPPCGRALKSSHHVQDGRLAAAGRTQQHADLVVDYIEGNIAHRHHAAAAPDRVLLGDMLQYQFAAALLREGVAGHGIRLRASTRGAETAPRIGASSPGSRCRRVPCAGCSPPLFRRDCGFPENRTSTTSPTSAHSASASGHWSD